MATITKPYTLVNGQVAQGSDVESNFTTIYNDYNGNITNANIAASAAIVDTKLDTIATAGKVNGAALTGLASVTSAAGIVPAINLATGATANTKFLRGDGTWAAVTTAKANTSRARAFLATGQSIPNGAWTKILLDTESYDVLGEFASNKFTATVAGYYLLVGSVQLDTIADGIVVSTSVYINNTRELEGNLFVNGGSGTVRPQAMDVRHLDATDYVELGIYQAGASTALAVAATNGTFLTVVQLTAD